MLIQPEMYRANLKLHANKLSCATQLASGMPESTKVKFSIMSLSLPNRRRSKRTTAYTQQNIDV